MSLENRGAGGAEAILQPYKLGTLNLKNRIVMAPMTRGRTEAEDRSPGNIEAKYYAQRASAGLIITGGTYISKQAIGSICVPGIYSEAQVEAWKRVTSAVHDSGGKIFLQIAHSGSVSNRELLGGELPVAPSSVNPLQKVFTPTGFRNTEVPRSLTISEIQTIVEDFGRAARNAREAGFDGVELHAAHVYLLPQFLSSATNHREDGYGGSTAARARIVLEALASIAQHWEKNRIGIKLSPGLNGLGAFVANDETLPTYDYLFNELNRFSPAYVQLMRPINDIGSTPVAELQEGTYKRYRPRFNGTLIANVGFERASANDVVDRGDADLVSFARHYIANPDLPTRFAKDAVLAEGEVATYYQGGASGYTTYPLLDAKSGPSLRTNDATN
jgi:N-ethylmaleimide reductase